MLASRAGQLDHYCPHSLPTQGLRNNQTCTYQHKPKLRDSETARLLASRAEQPNHYYLHSLQYGKDADGIANQSSRGSETATAGKQGRTAQPLLSSQPTEQIKQKRVQCYKRNAAEQLKLFDCNLAAKQPCYTK